MCGCGSVGVLNEARGFPGLFFVSGAIRRWMLTYCAMFLIYYWYDLRFGDGRGAHGLSSESKSAV